MPTEEVPNFHFQRIDPSKVVQFKNEMADNTFEAKARFGQGGGDSYGAWSNDKLKDKQGKYFFKEKQKMKNRNSHASGRFDQGAVNSIKF